ncbi:MAG: Ldh family oxidoreductase [Eubacteriales bacterium]
MKEFKGIDDVEKGIIHILKDKGVEEKNAEIVAKSLVFADARGTKSHGLNMLEAYIDRIENGGIAMNAIPEILKEDTNTVLCNGNNGFGQVTVMTLTKKLISKMKTSGISCGSARNLNHCGALAFYTIEAAKEGYVAFLFGNANPTVAPFNGKEAVLGTNPMSIAIPYGDKPIIVDMATSAVAKAKIYRAASLNERIDPSWALDKNGNPTDDPNEAIMGVLTTMAGPKGYGIAIAIEVLAGVLSGSGITHQVSSVHKKTDQGMNAGVFMILIDPFRFMNKEEYENRLSKLVVDIKSTRPQENKRITLPGELESILFDDAKKNGIEYYSSILQKYFDD